MPYGHLITATVMTLGVYVKVIHRLHALFYTKKRVVRSLCHRRASCFGYYTRRAVRYDGFCVRQSRAVHRR